MLLLNRSKINLNENGLLAISNFAKSQKNVSKSKVRLWYELKNNQLKGYNFKRQVPFYMYKLDFYCNNLKLVVEIEKNENRLKEKRLDYLGFTVLKFKPTDVFNNIDKVLKTIEKYIINFEYKRC